MKLSNLLPVMLLTLKRIKYTKPETQLAATECIGSLMALCCTDKNDVAKAKALEEDAVQSVIGLLRRICDDEEHRGC